MAVKFLVDLLSGNLVMVNVPGETVPAGALLMEDDSPILLEDGTYLIQE